MSTIDRRKFLSNLPLATAAVAVPNFVYSSFIRPEECIVAEITPGKIKGIRQDGVNSFKGIPYAGRISGDLLH